MESGGIARKEGLVGAPECRVPDKAGQGRAEQGRAGAGLRSFTA